MTEPDDDYDDARIGGTAPAPEHSPPIYPPQEPTPPAPPSAPQPSQPVTKAMARVSPVAGPWSQRLEPVTFNTTAGDPALSVWRSASLIVSARWFATKFSSREEISLVIMAGAARGWDVWSSLQNIDIIKGRPSFSSASIIAMAQSHAACVYLRPVLIEMRSCTWEAMRTGWTEPLRMTYTYEQAKLAGLTNPSRKGEPSQWDKRPQEMCTKQAGRMLARVAFADVCAGMYSADELATEVSYEVAS